MKTNDMVTISSVALSTAALTVLLFWSPSLEAGNEQEVLAAKIAQPKLVAKGVELTLVAAEGQTFQTGDRPEFVLQAVNPGAEPATLSLLAAMTGMSPRSELSRVMPMPAMLWQHPFNITLQPNETKTMKVATDTPLPANQIISVVLQETDGQPNPTAQKQPTAMPILLPVANQSSRIVALSFSTNPTTVPPTVAMTR